MKSGLAALLLMGMVTLLGVAVNENVWADEAGAKQTNSSMRFDPDNETDAIHSHELSARLGPIPTPRKQYRIGAVLKFLGNPYWQLLAKGMASKSNTFGFMIDMRAGATESDPVGQLALMEEMVTNGYDAILVSPQTDKNLVPAVVKAKKEGILLINVDDAVLEDAQHFIGPNQYEKGIRAARYFIEKYPAGGEVAVIKGLAGVYAVSQRSQGFIDTLAKFPFKIVSQVHGDWDLQTALEKANGVIRQYPDIIGFYCNNDIMALGVAQAIKTSGRAGQVTVIGTDGISSAYDAIREGEMTGTVDSFPYETGLVAIEVALRILGGQKVPRVVYSPQNLVTKENIDDPLPENARPNK